MEEQSQFEKVWNLVNPLVEECGFKTFDIELPGGPSGILRVFVWKGRGAEGIQLDECAIVGRKLNESVELDELIPGSYVLEVSSPGVNRKLSRAEHFVDAVGERVKVVLSASQNGRNTFCGLVRECNGSEVEIEDEQTSAPTRISLGTIKRANVDFDFSAVR